MSLYYKYNPLGLGNAQPPVVNVRGVFLQSNSILVSSAMTITGGTIGDDYPGNRMDVYSRGRAVDTVIRVGGSMNISSGGVASSAMVSSDGLLTVYNGGELVEPGVVTGGTISISSGGVLSGGVISSWNGAFIYINSGGVSYDTETRGIQFQVRSGGAAHRPVIRNGQIQLRGSVYDFVMSGGVISAYNGAGGIISGGTINGGGILLSAGRVASDVIVAGSNGYIWVRGGTIVNPVISATGAFAVSGGLASNFTSLDGAAVAIVSGGSATTAGTAYGVRVEEGAELTVESNGKLYIQSGKTAYGVTVSLGGSVVVSAGGVVVDGVFRGATAVHSTAILSGGTVLGGGSYATRNVVNVSGGTVVGATTSDFGYFEARYSGVLRDCHAAYRGYLQVGYRSYGYNLTVDSGGGIVTLSQSAYISGATISSGGYLEIGSGNTASAPTILNGGTMKVSSGGAALDVTSAFGAIVTVLEGGTITYKE